MCNHKLPLSKLKTLPVISLYSSFLILLSVFSFRLPLLMSHFVPRPQLAHPALRRAPACQAPVLCCRLLFLSSPFSSKLIRQLFAPAGRKSFGSSRPLLGEQWKVKSFTPGYRAAGLLLDRRTSAAREREREKWAPGSRSRHLLCARLCCNQSRSLFSIISGDFTAINHQSERDFTQIVSISL